MAAATGVVGAKLYITSNPIASTIDSEPEFWVQTYQQVGLIENVGEFGRVFETVPFIDVATGRTYKLKGAYNDGAFEFSMAQDLSDAGQATLSAAADDADQDNYGFALELNDAPSDTGGPTTFYWRGLPMSYRTVLGGANNVLRATAKVEINSDIIYLGPADLYDQFVSGDTLAHYTLFNGSDAESVDPVISAGTMVLVSGDAGTGFAADGSQAITDAGYTLSDGGITATARLKLSAITNVQMFFGLTDQVAALEIPIESAASANTITTNATDAVGFMFDTSMSTDNFWLVGVNNNVDETAQDAGSAPVADTYINLRVTLDSSGNATFFINGAAVGTAMTTACRTGVPLYLTLCVGARSTASRTLTVASVYLRQGA